MHCNVGAAEKVVELVEGTKRGESRIERAHRKAEERQFPQEKLS